MLDRDEKRLGLLMLFYALALSIMACVMRSEAQGCSGCEPWVQGPFDLDPSPHATASLQLGPAWALLDVQAKSAGACGPIGGSSCSLALSPCEAALTVSSAIPPGYVALFKASGMPWLPLPPRGYSGTMLSKCSWFAYASADVVIFDVSTMEHAETFIRWGCASCPLPD